jgi:hypothetical protein
MALFRDATGELIYSGPRFSDREKRVARLYGALITSTVDPEGVGAVHMTTSPPPGVEPGQENVIAYQTGGSLKRTAIHGRNLAEMPGRARFGEDGSAGFDVVNGYHPDYHGAGLMMPKTIEVRSAPQPQTSMPRREAQDAMAP